MSWLQWQGVTLPTTEDEAELELRLIPADAPGPVQGWSLELTHQVPRTDGLPGDSHLVRYIALEVPHLGIQVRHWHELAGRTLRPTPQFIEEREHCTPLGHLPDFALSVTDMEMPSRFLQPRQEVETRYFRTLDYELRFGQWDGLCLACELDAWLLPEEEFWRTEPETEAELRAVPQGPPDLRVMARAVFGCVRMEMPNCGPDPVPMALKRLEQEVGELPVQETTVEWMKNYSMSYGGKTTGTPGVRSEVTVLL